MIRRLKRDVLTQLPPKQRKLVSIVLDARKSKEITMIFEKLKKEAKKVHYVEHVQARAALHSCKKLFMELYADSAVVKIQAVFDYIKDMLESEGEKFLVFCHHQNMMDGICSLLEKESVNYMRIDGRTPTHTRQDSVNRLQEDPYCRVAVLSMLAAGSGLTLHAASNVIFSELYWNPGVLLQCEDRAHRIGQQASCINIHYLIAQDTLDKYIWDMVSKKLDVLGRALDGEKAELQTKTTEMIIEDSEISNSYIQQLLASLIKL